ncbi:hypothetical protein IB286_03920 [Spongiibacter sp. KMU-158]|uniref:Outer membrane protein beta-barrel domain-containing protein n=1 Tax=Spongiibacter pelagi TaxID=2760804 RepID=A0A927BZX3_9GAMM|nr:hypothetical protein [Spongiibacter pelagi]MBD2858144.1 hypothetical protein [Spongiibacter pelagi]
MRFSIIGGIALGLAASQVMAEITPRVGLGIGSYEQIVFAGGAFSDNTAISIAPSAGVSIGTQAGFIFDLGIETLATEVLNQSTGEFDDGYRTELTAFAGYPFLPGAFVIAGYRTADYGESIGDDESGSLSGPMLGVAMPDLRIGGSDTNIMSFMFAIQQGTYEIGAIEEDGEGATIRLGFRRSDSNQSFGLRYQVFGSDESFDEWVTTLQWTYNFVGEN